MTPMRQQITGWESVARGRLDPGVYDYVAGGSGEEISLDEAVTAWRRHRLRPRAFGVSAPVDTSVSLLGADLPSPVGVAPIGYQQLVDDDGETTTASGTGGHLFVNSARSDRAVADVAAARAAVWWQQHYVTVDEVVGDELALRAAEAGASALVLTLDTPHVAAKARQGRLRELPHGAEQRPVVRDDVPRLAQLTGLPVIVKGVLRAESARAAVEAGAAGVVVSNHGGRQLDRAVASATALPEVVAAMGDAPVLVDGGIRSGHDVLIALALGARAVLVGRPVIWALASDGADGVRALLDGLTAELAQVMELAGCDRLDSLGPDLVHRDVGGAG